MINRHQILNSYWLLSPQAVEGYLPLLAAFMRSGNSSFEAIDPKEGINYASSRTYVLEDMYDLRYTKNNQGIDKGSKIVIPVRSAMTKRSQMCGPAGMEEVASLLRQLYADENVDAICMYVESPGGQVTACQAIMSAIQERTKPVVAFVDDVAASAAYGMISQCDRITVNHANCVIGSIGTMCTAMDYSKFFEAQGVTIHELYATKSTEKNKDWRDLKAGDPSGIISDLDFLNDWFQSAILSGRPQLAASREKWDKGAEFYANEAIELGLVDAIGTLDDALNFEINN